MSSSTPAITSATSATSAIRPQNLQVNYSNPPPESQESPENIHKRESVETFFRQLNSPVQSIRDRARAIFRQRRPNGKNWVNVRNTVREQFRAVQNTKKKQRWQAEKNYRNAQWANYTQRYIAAAQAQPLEPGVPRMGHPPRISNGMRAYTPYVIPKGGKSKKTTNRRRKHNKTKKNSRR